MKYVLFRDTYILDLQIGHALKEKKSKGHALKEKKEKKLTASRFFFFNSTGL